MSFDDVIFTVSDQNFTLGQLLVITTTLVGGYLVIRWLPRIITNRLAARNLQPDLVHLMRRIFYIVALAVLLITLLDLINVPLTAFAFASGAVAIFVFASSGCLTKMTSSSRSRSATFISTAALR